MAGSYMHITNADGSFAGIDLIDNLGDAHEALEECHDMIAWLTGGNRHRIHAAHLHGHLMKRHEHVRANPNDPIYSFEKYWENSGPVEADFAALSTSPQPEGEPIGPKMEAEIHSGMCAAHKAENDSGKCWECADRDREQAGRVNARATAIYAARSPDGTNCDFGDWQAAFNEAEDGEAEFSRRFPAGGGA
jgi:hypothetical protein